MNYIQICENASEIEELRAGAKLSLQDFFSKYQQLRNTAQQEVVSDLIQKIIDLIGYEEYLRENFSKEEFDAKIDNLAELRNVASEYNGMDPWESLSQFLEEVALITDMDSKDEREEYVTLMTIHTSK